MKEGTKTEHFFREIYALCKYTPGRKEKAPCKGCLRLSKKRSSTLWCRFRCVYRKYIKKRHSVQSRKHLTTQAVPVSISVKKNTSRPAKMALTAMAAAVQLHLQLQLKRVMDFHLSRQHMPVPGKSAESGESCSRENVRKP